MWERIRAVIPFIVIFTVITFASWPVLQSGDKLLINADFFQYASRHEAVRKSIVEYHALPLRSPWLGGGYPTIGDPEDPTFNPLVICDVLFGTVMGIKVIGFLALLIGGLSTYALGHYVLGYTRWGALFSGLIYGTCLFVPLRIVDGNINEVYAAFLPVCLLLVGLAYQRHKSAIIILPFVFFTMLSDGKLTCLMAMFFCGVVCCCGLIPGLQPLGSPDANASVWRVDYRPLKFFLIAVALTFLIGMVRILPAHELLHGHGGAAMLAYRPKTYQPSGVYAYKFNQLWEETIGWGGRIGLVTVGWLPVVLSGIAVVVFWRRMLAWGLALVLFSWLALAHHAPYDLLKLSWYLPVFEAIYRPYKYFTFQIVWDPLESTCRHASLSIL